MACWETFVTLLPDSQNMSIVFCSLTSIHTAGGVFPAGEANFVQARKKVTLGHPGVGSDLIVQCPWTRFSKDLETFRARRQY